MHWEITVSGTKAEALHSASDQADRLISVGKMTNQEKEYVMAKISALPGPHISGAITHSGDTLSSRSEPDWPMNTLE